ncbi:hypothetical protein PENDEC_c010G06974 [Penicillium decumbens]|uniref:WSC domain-containing protein n=1 Tax=Penicillium decumbens TaxID=69771 RepID=A0A1V6PC26_PENDC|nr:hypothetical protein PENDEC_c010G06974 [Penicillium decumbens]
MRFTATALIASSLLLASSAAAKSFDFDIRLAPRGGMTFVGCYSSSQGLGSKTSYTFQSSGWCQDRCSGSGYNSAVFALTGGSDCLCGDELPPDSAKASKDKCNTPCDGWPQDMCGGSGFYSVYTTGLDPDVSSVSASTTSDGSKSTATNTNGATAAVSTAGGGETTVVTSSSRPQQPSADDMGAQQKSTHNTAAIAAGVVVGVVGVAALAGAVWFFYRSKKQKAQGFRGTSGGYHRDSQPPSMSDSRFDGGYMAQRRQSNGSIDDDHDFSRRILQVTNPDRGHY